ncbi:MAG: radical SAM protein [bacterium]|nr:radical SAM protein [bacterium]
MDKTSEKKLIIYLADLDHFRPGNRFHVPLGIGSIASFCKKELSDSIEIFLFKDPDELIREIRRRPPDILGCSLFMWNTNLTFKMIEACKIISQQTITVIGGASIARNSDHFKKILETHLSLDIIVIDQGEKSFLNIINRILESQASPVSIFKENLDGCAFRLDGTGKVIRGKIISEGIDINTFPSPYLTGYLDKFLHAGFVATLETARGCPHQCTFCCGGANTFMPLSIKNEQTVYDELQYISKHSTSKEVEIADTNFGIMGERDLRISSFMLDLYKKTGFPRLIVSATTKQKTKTSIEMMINTARMMGSFYFALQTLTEPVLNNCKRKNIPVETIREIVAIAKPYHLPTEVDTIFGLPGETLKSFMETVDKILSLGVTNPAVYILKLLPGTVIAEVDREKYGYKTKFRPLNGRYGEYNLISGRKPIRIIESEEIAWQNNSFGSNDYLTIRSFGLVTWLLVGKEAFSDSVTFLFSRGIKMTEIFNLIMENYVRYPRLNNLFKQYKAYSEVELFDNEKELMEKITGDDKQWKDLLADQGTFFKLDHGFSGYCLFEDTGALDEIAEIIIDGVKNKLSCEDSENLKEVIRQDKQCRIIQDKKAGKLTKKDIRKEFAVEEIYDYEKWRADDFKGSFKNYRFSRPVKRIYYLDQFDLFNTKIDEFSSFSNYVFYEKMIIWGPQRLRRLRTE